MLLLQQHVPRRLVLQPPECLLVLGPIIYGISWFLLVLVLDSTLCY